MGHATFMQINHGDFWILLGESQIGILTFGPFFGYNLCLKYWNGSWEPSKF
jgi:hypothetical protein